MRDLTEGMNASASGLVWRGDHEILFTEDVDGGGGISTLNVANGKAEMIWKGAETLHQDGNYPNFALSKDGLMSAAIRSTGESARSMGGRNRRLEEDHPCQCRSANTLGKSGKPDLAERWQQGTRLAGLSGKLRPGEEVSHGGGNSRRPAGMRSASWPSSHFDMSVMAGLGYFVFFPNPRGSYGEGEDFTKANVKDFGGGDLRDILAGVDEVVKKAPIDQSRIGVTGWSYGGYMTMWTVTQTQRFSAAVAGAGIADWQSYYGENSIDEWMIPYFGASVYDDPAVYAKSSPITFIKQVKTPTLVVVGERDGECPGRNRSSSGMR